jgi:hypothetical protein
VQPIKHIDPHQTKKPANKRAFLRLVPSNRDQFLFIFLFKKRKDPKNYFSEK